MIRNMQLRDLILLMQRAYEKAFNCTFDLWMDPGEGGDGIIGDILFSHPGLRDAPLTLRIFNRDTFSVVGDPEVDDDNLLIMSEVLKNAHQLMSILELKPDS